MNHFKILAFLAIFLLWSCEDYGQLKKIQHLPATLKEVSGMEKFPKSDLIWMINDSGNKNILYGLQPGNSTLKTIAITNAENKDWEDLARDTSGNLYIGDFGNNRNKREDLVIYKVKNPEGNTSGKTTATKIIFALEDQTEYPPKRKNRNFDIEAFVHLNGNLYLFTKNRSSKSNGVSKIYRLTDQPGESTAELIGEFQSCKKKSCWITGAAVSPDRKRLALLTNKSVHIISDFKDDNFTTGKTTHLEFGHNSQKESIIFKDDSTIYVADEQTGAFGRNLYEFSLN
ncbi:hypothetical protein [Salegentibacter flavus]|uniref:SdiA-regulated n=1 Tax=Salegentibacter flavus TaxID=287099 RepID=A0A1I5A8Q9_9FLAO|nr:hypothetical protein [Salegentibacter flavus]SFN58529.1 hypothetical protein SAMN05660413_01724 [Salegentibacter flavus]